MANVVGGGGLEGVPSLQSICDLFRALVNDDTFSAGGQIVTNEAAFVKPFLNSAIRDLYSELRMVGDMRVIVDNALINNLPNIAAANPETQVALAYQGYFDGSTWNPNYVLPPDLMWVMKVWQRQSGSGGSFFPMQVANDGLYGGFQGSYLGMYEVRGNNEIWFNGALQPVDLRLRYMATFPDIVGDNIDFTSTYVPIQDCTNAIAQRMVANYCQRLSPEQYGLADVRVKEYTKKLVSESVLNSQNKQFARQPFGSQDCT